MFTSRKSTKNYVNLQRKMQNMIMKQSEVQSTLTVGIVNKYRRKLNNTGI